MFCKANIFCSVEGEEKGGLLLILEGQRHGQKRRRGPGHETQKNRGLRWYTLIYSAAELIHMLASFTPFTVGATRTSGLTSHLFRLAGCCNHCTYSYTQSRPGVHYCCTVAGLCVHFTIFKCSTLQPSLKFYSMHQ